jgi:hypothetical protein
MKKSASAAKAHSRKPSRLVAQHIDRMVIRARRRRLKGDRRTGREHSVSPVLAEKCARAKALMEEAQQLLEEVVGDPGYDPDHDPAWPRLVCAQSALEHLPDAIEMLTSYPVPVPGDDDYVERSHLN